MKGMLEYAISSPFTVVIFAVLAVFFLAFGWKFVWPAWSLSKRLDEIVTGLRKPMSYTKKSLEPVFSVDPTLSHLWTKYAETLHVEQEQGGGKPIRLRSTVPASSIFTVETIVDARTSTEFFKHLPGIFTGIGILGTFKGLISGLQHFDAGGDTDAVHASLSSLMGNVSEAFYVSATAIFLAMVVTLIERTFVTKLYKQVDDTNTILDGFFSSGVGEEYLGRLTRASEDSAAQSRILKDALVGDLERILTTLAERQMEVQSAGMRQLGEDLTRGVAGALAGPLDKLAQTASQNTNNNGDAVTRLLTDVLAGFSQKMEDLFGGQIGGINKLQKQTIDSLTSAVAKLNELVSSVEQAGTKSADAMNQRLISAIGDMESHQKAANETMAAFVDRMREAVDQSQAETARKLQETLSRIGVAVEAQLAALKEQGERSGEVQARRDGETAARTEELLRTLGSNVGQMLDAMRRQAEEGAASGAERDRRAAAATEEAMTRLASAVEAQLAVMREHGERAGAAGAEREATQARGTAELLAGIGGKVEQILGAVGARADDAARAQEERERRAAEGVNENSARLAAAVEAQLAAMREGGERSSAAAAARDDKLAAQTAETLKALGARVDEMLTSFRSHFDRMTESQGSRDRESAQAMSAAIANLSGVAERVLNEAKGAVAGMSAAVDAMRGVTTSAVDKMNSGSERLFSASTEFANAGSSVAGVFRESEALAHGLRQSAGAIESASQALGGVVADHGAARDVLKTMLGEMHGIVENAKREAGMTTDALTRIEAASRGLGQAHRQAEEYLAEVTKILGATHEKYAASLASTMGDQYKAFYAHLSEAIGLLQGAIQELAVTVQPVGVKRAAE